MPDPALRAHRGLNSGQRLVLSRQGDAQGLLTDLADACVDDLLIGPPTRNEESFDEAVRRCSVQLPGSCADGLAHLVSCLEPAWQAEQAIAALTSPVVAESVADIRSELQRLFGAHLVTRFGVRKLADLRRYGQALAWRAERLAAAPAADASRLASVRAAERVLAEHIAAWPVHDPAGADARHAYARQLLDEYRVSVFAQHLRTAMPVSQRRIEKYLADLGT